MSLKHFVQLNKKAKVGILKFGN